MDDIENKILLAARDAFIESGYTDTSMSEIALRVGINRPTLHYYFRTKDRLFQAVFGEIVLAVVPHIKEIVLQNDRSVGERVEKIVDFYYKLFMKQPSLPIFIVREINRDADHFIDTLQALNAPEAMKEVIVFLREEMEAGKLRQVPLQYVFFTFYGMLTYPFFCRHLSERIFDNNQPFSAMLHEWKHIVASQMEALLQVN